MAIVLYLSSQVELFYFCFVKVVCFHNHLSVTKEKIFK